MYRNQMILLLFAGAGCTSTGSFQGKLVNAMSGDPVAEVRLLAKAPDSPDLTCQVKEANTAVDGTFLFDGLCADTNYVVTSTDKTLVLVGVSQVAGGVKATTTEEVKAWRAPTGNGVFLLAMDKLKPLKTVADVGSSYLWESEETVRYPKTLPKKVTRIMDDQYLVLSGARAIEKMKFHPLIKSGERKFGNKKEPEPSVPWWYIGMRFQSDTEYERITAEPDKDKQIEVQEGDTHVVYLPSDALPPAHYVLLADMDRRTYMVTFGPEIPAPGADVE